MKESYTFEKRKIEKIRVGPRGLQKQKDRYDIFPHHFN